MIKILGATFLISLLTSWVSGTDFVTFTGVVLAAVLSTGGVVYTVKSNRRMQREAAAEKRRLVSQDRDSAQKQTQVAVDAQAYQRARESYEASIANYAREIASLNARVRAAEREARRATARVFVLEGSLRENGISVPAEPFDDEDIPGG